MQTDDTILIPGPSFRVDLSPLDACHPVHYSGRLSIFRCASSTQRQAQLAALTSGLHKLVLRCPLVAGRVVPLPLDGTRDTKMERRTIVPDRGLELVVKDLQAHLPSIEELEAAGYPSSSLPYDLLVPIPEDIDNGVPFAACKVQFSAIKGGTIITFSVSHSVCDGSGTNELTRILSEETCLAQLKSTEQTKNEQHSTPVAMVGMDRSVLLKITSDIPFNIGNHPGYTSQTSLTTRLKTPEEIRIQSFKKTRVEIPVLLHISPSNLAKLKADATLAHSPPISTHDALSALMWRSVLLIRSRRSGIAKEELAPLEVQLLLPSDARRHLQLPSSYVGNAVYQLMASLNLGTLLSPSGLQHAATALRRTITAASPGLVASYFTRMRESWVDWQFPLTMYTSGVPMGTDWTSSELYKHDWGEAFGPLVRYRYPKEASNCILPKLPDGGAEVMVSVMPEEVEFLESLECFGKYIV